MRLKNRLTPYPILSKYNDDYVDSYFESHLDVNHEFNTVTIKAVFDLKNPTITELISSNKASYLLHVECSSSAFRRVFTTNNQNYSLELPNDSLLEKVEVCSFIVANDNLEYTNPDFNKAYGRYSVFSLSPGDLIAVGDAIEFTVQRTKDDLEDLPSIIKIYKIKKMTFLSFFIFLFVRFLR